MTSKISIPLKKLSKTSFDLTEKSFDSELLGDWVGDTGTKNLFLNTYIQEKFKNSLHTLPFVDFRLLYSRKHQNSCVALVDNGVADRIVLEFDEDFQPYLKKYKQTDKRFTFYPITTTKYSVEDSPGDVSGHAVSALYDKKINKVEIFDSIGSDFTRYKQSFKDFFVRIYGENVKIVYMVDRCVAFGKLEALKCDYRAYKYRSDGFCVIWVLWFLELRLSNPDIPKEKLVEKALKQLKVGDKVCKILRGYGQFVDKTVAKYRVVRTRSNLAIKPKKSVITKKDYSYLYALLASLVGSIVAFDLLSKFRKKRLLLDRQS